KKYEFIDWGYHGFNHLPFTLISDDELKEELKNIFMATSITAPLWMVEDKKDPSRVFNAMKKGGYKITVYKGTDDGINHSHHYAIKKVETRYGMKCVCLSNCFEGNSPMKHINKILQEIKENADKDAVYCLSTHDFTHKNTENLKKIILTLQTYKKEGRIKLANLKRLL
ncbi:hypothetical protein HY643_03815, partial [Candidatus Woesearchaeota archaeon]|nr:hypothetical protein [Candidatus Woesearchaeota archaeon]